MRALIIHINTYSQWCTVKQRYRMWHLLSSPYAMWKCENITCYAELVPCFLRLVVILLISLKQLMQKKAGLELLVLMCAAGPISDMLILDQICLRWLKITCGVSNIYTWIIQATLEYVLGHRTAFLTERLIELTETIIKDHALECLG